MREHFTPEDVSQWTESDLETLIGNYVVVEVEASEWFKEHNPDGGDWEGGAGVCEDAGVRSAVDRDNKTIEIRFVHWDYGMGWSWRPDQIVHIHVCDEHGDHRDESDKKTQKCLRTLGVRSALNGGHGGEEASPRSKA